MMNYDENEVMGMVVIAIGALVLSFLMPGWIAAGLGLAQTHADLVAWWHTLALWLKLPTLAAYLVAGFLMLVMIGIVIGFLAYWSFIGVKAVTIRLAAMTIATMERLGQAIAAGVGLGLHLAFEPMRLAVARIGDAARDRIELIQARLEERRELRRLYREEYADDFKSFRAFKAYWDALQNGEEPGADGDTDPPKADPFTRAVHLFGLPESFGKADLEKRYRTLMRGVHPDIAGPNELAQQLNEARDLINRRMGWA